MSCLRLQALLLLDNVWLTVLQAHSIVLQPLCLLRQTLVLIVLYGHAPKNHT